MPRLLHGLVIVLSLLVGANLFWLVLQVNQRADSAELNVQAQTLLRRMVLVEFNDDGEQLLPELMTLENYKVDPQSLMPFDSIRLYQKALPDPILLDEVVVHTGLPTYWVSYSAIWIEPIGDQSSHYYIELKASSPMRGSHILWAVIGGLAASALLLWLYRQYLTRRRAL